jgi:hypothetical protein
LRQSLHSGVIFTGSKRALSLLITWLASVNPASAISTESLAPSTSGESAWNVLLAASCADLHEGVVRAWSLFDRKIDWEEVLRLADHHGTSSLLYQNLSPLSDIVAPSILSTLRERHESNIRKSLFLTRELIRIGDRLDGLGIEVIPYKGLVLSEIYYGDTALRQSGDIDLFVRRQDVGRIKELVRDLGYTTRVPLSKDAEEDYLDSGYECTFDSQAGCNVLELQWALQPRFYAVDFDMEELFARAVNVTIAGRSMKIPSPEDLLLVLSVHAAKHVWGRLIWLCDIAQILKRDKLNWDWVQSRARNLGIERILHVTLLLTERFLQTAIPAPIENAVRSDRAAHAFADEFAASVIHGVSYRDQQILYFRLMMRLRERRLDQARFLTRLAFTPGPGEWEAIRLPKILFPLYRAVRLARLAARFGKK